MTKALAAKPSQRRTDRVGYRSRYYPTQSGDASRQNSSYPCGVIEKADSPTSSLNASNGGAAPQGDRDGLGRHGADCTPDCGEPVSAASEPGAF